MFSVNKTHPLYLIFIFAVILFFTGGFSHDDQKKYVFDQDSSNYDSFLEQEFNKLKSPQSFDSLGLIPYQSVFYFISYLLICCTLFKYSLTSKTIFNFSSRSPPVS